MKGLVIFYVNFPDLDVQKDQEIKAILDMLQRHNQDLVDKLKAEGYEISFMACTKESSRVEKFDI